MLSSNPELMLLLTVQCYRWGNYSIERLLLAQGYRGWESQDLNASSRSMLWCIMHTASLGIGAHQAGLAWSLDTLITTFWGLPGTPGLWAIMPLPDAEICSSQLPPFATVPLNGASLFLQILPVSPIGVCGSPTYHVHSVRTRTHLWQTLLDACLHQWCTIGLTPHWTWTQTHLGFLLKAEPLAFIFISSEANTGLRK